jgi:hypothetical protein
MMKNMNEIAGKNPFKIPENYFEDVNRKIISATAGHEKEVKKTSLYRRLRPYVAIAASVAGFLLLSYVTLKMLTPAKSVPQVSENTYSVYTESYLDDIDIQSLENDAASLENYDEVPDVSKKEIIDYLLLDNIEISDIYDQL